MVYFIELVGTPYIKIGFTDQIWKRLRNLRSQNPYPVRLLGTCEGDRVDEATYHVIFKDYRVHGDWFKKSKKVKRFLDEKFPSHQLTSAK